MKRNEFLPNPWRFGSGSTGTVVSVALRNSESCAKVAKLRAELISNVVAGLALLVAVTSSSVTLLLSRRTLRINSYKDTTTQVLDIDRMLVEYPHLRPYFYDNETPPAKGEPDHHRVLAAAELYLDVAENIWRHHAEYIPDDVIGWREWIHDLFQYSPVLRDLLAEGTYLYPALKDLLEKEPCSQSGHRLALGFLHGSTGTPVTTTTSS